MSSRETSTSENSPLVKIIFADRDTLEQILIEYLDAILKHDSNIPDGNVFRLAGLVKKNGFSFLRDIGTHDMRNALKQLLLTGTYNETFIELLIASSAQIITEKIGSRKKLKRIIRTMRLLAFFLEYLTILQVRHTGQEPFPFEALSIATTLFLWEMIDKVTNDVLLRVIIRSLIVREALIRAYVLPEDMEEISNDDHVLKVIQVITNQPKTNTGEAEQYLKEIQALNRHICFLLDVGFDPEKLLRIFKRSPIIIPPIILTKNTIKTPPNQNIRSILIGLRIEKIEQTLSAKLVELVAKQKNELKNVNQKKTEVREERRDKVLESREIRMKLLKKLV